MGEKLNRVNYVIFTFIICLSVFSCSDSSTNSPEEGKGKISGIVQYLDGTPGYSALIELKTLPSNSKIYDTADVNGEYKFENLKSGNYLLSFEKTGYEIKSYEKTVTLKEDEQITEDIYIVYNMLDESFAMVVDTDIVFIRFNPDAAKIGDNYEMVSHLSGYYRRDILGTSTLSSQVYIIPEGFNWTNPGVELNAQYIKDNFIFVTEVEDNFLNGTHEIRYTGDDIPKILSNPQNGFAFVRKEGIGKQIQIPCVDYNNNDFGLLIFYK